MKSGLINKTVTRRSDRSFLNPRLSSGNRSERDCSSIKQRLKSTNFRMPFPFCSTGKGNGGILAVKGVENFLGRVLGGGEINRRVNCSGFDGSTLSSNSHPGLLEGNQPDNPINKLAGIHAPHVPIVVLDLIDHLSLRSIYYSITIACLVRSGALISWA